MNPPTYSLLIAGVERAGQVDQASWTISQHFGRQGDTASFTLVDHHPTSNTVSFHIAPLSTVILTDTSIGKVLFSGLVTKPVVVPGTNNFTTWHLDCRDWTYYADTIYVNGDFLGQTGDKIAKSLIAQANIGLTTTNISAAPTISRIQVNYESLSKALTRIARMSSQTSTYGWYIDESKDVHFFSEDQSVAPTVTFTDTLSTNPTSTLGYYEHDQVQYEYDGQSLRNSCIVRGSSYIGRTTDKFVANGSQAAWPLTYPFNHGGDLPVLKINGTHTAVQVLSSPTQIIEEAYALTRSLIGQWFLITGTFGTPGNGAQISLNYQYIAPIIARADNPTSQAAFPGSNNGVFQMYLADTGLVTYQAAQSRAQAELQQFQWTQERVTFTTNEGFPGHVRAGDTITWSTQRIPDSQNGYATGFSDTFLIISSSIHGSLGGYRKYSLVGTRT